MSQSFRTHALLSLMTCLSLACATRSEAGGACPVIEMSAVADTPTDSNKSVSMNGTTILMSRTPLVTTGDITGAAASAEGDAWIVRITVSDAAAKRVQEFTGQNVGKKMALAVDGKVSGTPRIAGAVTGNRYQIDGLTRADAERLAAALSNGCR